MISSVLSGRSRPRGSGHTHRTARTGFVVGGCPHRVRERIDRVRRSWPHAKCGAAALFCGVPPRLTPWAVRNSLGLPTGAFWLHTRPKKFSNSYSQFGLRGRAPRGVTGELSPASVYVSLLPVVEACVVGQNKITFNRDSRVFAVFSTPLRPSPDPRTPP